MSEPQGTPTAPPGPRAVAARAVMSSARRRTAILVIAGGALVAATILALFWRHASTRESTDDAQIEGNIVPVSARVGGPVKQVMVEDNQAVEAGAVLMQIEPTDYEVALRKAEAELADAASGASAASAAVPITSTTASSQLATARASVAAAKQAADAARARVEEAKANYEKVASDLKRYRELVEKDEISRQQYDAAVAAEAAGGSAVAEAQAAFAAAQSRVIEAEAQLRAAGTAPAQVDVARARAEAADAARQKNAAAVEQARLDLGYTTVRSPAAGIVSRKAVQPGQVVQPGQQVLAVVPLDRIWVVANFKESQLRRMRPGQTAEVYVDAYSRTYRGHVESIGGATAAKFSLLPPENATGNFVKVVQRVPVKIVLEKDQDPDHLLRPGMSVVPTVLTR